MKKLSYYICFCLFCFILTNIPVVGFADGVTSNGGVSFTPVRGTEQKNQNSESPEEKQSPKRRESKKAKGVLPRTNSEKSWLLLFLGIFTMSSFFIIKLRRRKRLEH